MRRTASRRRSKLRLYAAGLLPRVARSVPAKCRNAASCFPTETQQAASLFSGDVASYVSFLTTQQAASLFASPGSQSPETAASQGPLLAGKRCGIASRRFAASCASTGDVASYVSTSRCLRRCSRAEARAADGAADLAVCRPPAAAGTAWSGSAGPIVIAGDRSRSGSADESSGLLQLFLRLSTFAALPWRHCKQRLYGYAVQWGRFGRLARLSPTWLAFAALIRRGGL